MTQVKCSVCHRWLDWTEDFDGYRSALDAPGIFVDITKPECDDCATSQETGVDEEPYEEKELDIARRADEEADRETKQEAYDRIMGGGEG